LREYPPFIPNLLIRLKLRISAAKTKGKLNKEKEKDNELSAASLRGGPTDRKAIGMRVDVLNSMQSTPLKKKRNHPRRNKGQ